MTTKTNTPKLGKGRAARTDFNPADWAFIGSFYVGMSEDMQDAYAGDHAHLDSVLPAWGDMDLGKCGSCGTYHAHGAFFRNADDGELLPIGHICASNYFAYTNVMSMRQAAARRAKARREQQEAWAAEAAAKQAEFWKTAPKGLKGAFRHYGIEAGEAGLPTHHIIVDIESKLNKWGSISDKQVDFVLKLAAEMSAPAKEEVPAVPIPADMIGKRIWIEGTVATTKYQESQYGGAMKMLVIVEGDGGEFKFWGSIPGAIDMVDLDTVQWIREGKAHEDRTEIHYVMDARPLRKGDKVRFRAASTQVSDGDKDFGFFKLSSASKAEVLA